MVYPAGGRGGNRRQDGKPRSCLSEGGSRHAKAAEGGAPGVGERVGAPHRPTRKSNPSPASLSPAFFAGPKPGEQICVLPEKPPMSRVPPAASASRLPSSMPKK